MARFEVTARATIDTTRHLPALLALRTTGRGHVGNARLRRVTTAGSGQITVMLQPRSRRTQPDGGWLLARHSLFELGIAPAEIQQVDVHRVSRHGHRRTLVRSWSGGADGPGTAGVREPRNPLPAPPTLRAALDLP